MTRQLRDMVTYQGEEYELAGFSGERFPIPQLFGIEPEDGATNCYRGYVINCKIRNEHLVLTDMMLWFWQGEIPSELIKAVDRSTEPIHHNRHNFQLDYVSTFTGGMIIGRDVIMPMYPRGRAVPESFDTILELIFEDGKLQIVHDHSEAVRQLHVDVKEQLRHDLRDLLKQPPPPPKQPLTGGASLLQRIQTKASESKPKSFDELIQQSKEKQQAIKPQQKQDHRLTWRNDHWDVSWIEFTLKVSERVADIWAYEYEPLA